MQFIEFKRKEIEDEKKQRLDRSLESKLQKQGQAAEKLRKVREQDRARLSELVEKIHEKDRRYDRVKNEQEIKNQQKREIMERKNLEASSSREQLEA